LRSAGNVELAEDGAQLVRDGARGGPAQIRDLRVTAALDQPPQHSLLGERQRGRQIEVRSPSADDPTGTFIAEDRRDESARTRILARMMSARGQYEQDRNARDVAISETEQLEATLHGARHRRRREAHVDRDLLRALAEKHAFDHAKCPTA
jgi:hypothetical protein